MTDSRKKALHSQVRKAALFVAAALITGIFLFPVYWIFATSFKSPNEIFSYPPAWVPEKLRFDNYLQIVRDGEIRALWNSLALASVSTVAACLVGTVAAYSLVRFKTGGRSLPLFVISLRVIPPVVVVFPLFLVFIELGWVDRFYGLALLYTAMLLPYVIWVMRGYVQDIPIELEESAMIDGCTRWGVLRRIVLPLVRNGLFATAVFAFIMTMNEFVFGLALTRTNIITYPVQIANLYGEQATYWAKISALSVLGSLPVFVAVLGLQRYLIRGVGVGAVKG